ncbi:hypothetical protein ABZP36_021982 [Zizania latifolia]
MEQHILGFMQLVWSHLQCSTSSSCHCNGPLIRRYQGPHITLHLPPYISYNASTVEQQLPGSIPSELGLLSQLRNLNLSMNSLEGDIPQFLGSSLSLQYVDLGNNALTGSIPESLANSSSIQVLRLMSNNLSGELPKSLLNTSSLIAICLQQNRFVGSIPAVTAKSSPIKYLYLKENYISGTIPSSLGNLSSLLELYLSKNNLVGNIPESLGHIQTLEMLSLSVNNLSGLVPPSLFNISSLMFLAMGNNSLTGRLPSGIGYTLPIIQGLILPKNKFFGPIPDSLLNAYNLKMLYLEFLTSLSSLQELNLSFNNFDGMVPRGGIFDIDDAVSIKGNAHLCTSVPTGADSSGADFKALVFQYMANGDLDTWLHPKANGHSERTLNFNQRINIVLDVAFALDYLHNHCASQLVHCDLKPSNILLDLDMVAYVSDFGLARCLSITSNAYEDSSKSLAQLKGSIGYIPPEYGVSEVISTKGDVYSFGVLLLEMITGASPTDERFNDGTSLRELVARAFPNNTYEIVDPTMLNGEINTTTVMQKCIIPLVRIGLYCSMASPTDRWEMGQVCAEILRIKHVSSSINGV